MSVVSRFLSRRGTPPVVDARRGLQAAAEWLMRAQDASGDGGVSASYDVFEMTCRVNAEKLRPASLETSTATADRVAPLLDRIDSAETR